MEIVLISLFFVVITYFIASPEKECVDDSGEIIWDNEKE